MLKTTQATAGKAIVVGGSLGGLFAANLLHRAGWDVTVFERVADELAGRGAGIVTHPELFGVMRAAGLPTDDSIGVQVDTRVSFARDGSVLGEQHAPQILTAWSKLYHLLRAALPDACYRSGVHVAGVEDHHGGARVIGADGTVDEADLVVAADGFRSMIRQQLLPDTALEYAGYIAWRGLVEERDLSAQTRAALFDKFAFCLPQQEQMLGYPVAGRDNDVTPGHRRYNFVWYRPADAGTTLRDLLTDDAGRAYPTGIAPGAIRADVIEAMQDAARASLSPQFQEIVLATRQPLFQPIYDLTVPRMAFGHVALLGDAAYVVRPHCGMGVTKAASDALTLVRAVTGQGVTAGLRAYETARRAFGEAIVGHARHLGAYMQSQLRSETERAMAERYRTPEAVMRETAIPPRFAHV
jgi:2-polyprenyl-6-methoxyphenol hydroxylase-like FAD-dependent oxidoreductase